MQVDHTDIHQDSRPDRWSWLVRVFHWLSLVWLVAVYVLIMLYGSADDGDAYLAWHKALGVSFAIWILARALNRLWTRAPVALLALTDLDRWANRLAHVVHVLLYALMLLMPLTGFLMTEYDGRTVSLFGLLTIPLLVTPDTDIHDALYDLHGGLCWSLLLGLTALHVLAAIYHQWVRRDGLMRRML